MSIRWRLLHQSARSITRRERKQEKEESERQGIDHFHVQNTRIWSNVERLVASHVPPSRFQICHLRCGLDDWTNRSPQVPGSVPREEHVRALDVSPQWDGGTWLLRFPGGVGRLSQQQFELGRAGRVNSGRHQVVEVSKLLGSSAKCGWGCGPCGSISHHLGLASVCRVWRGCGLRCSTPGVQGPHFLRMHPPPPPPNQSRHQHTRGQTEDQRNGGQCRAARPSLGCWGVEPRRMGKSHGATHSLRRVHKRSLRSASEVLVAGICWGPHSGGRRCLFWRLLGTRNCRGGSHPVVSCLHTHAVGGVRSPDTKRPHFHLAWRRRHQCNLQHTNSPLDVVITSVAASFGLERVQSGRWGLGAWNVNVQPRQTARHCAKFLGVRTQTNQSKSRWPRA